MNFKIKLILLSVISIYFGDVNGQNDLFKHTVPESYKKMVRSKERKSLDSLTDSYRNIEDTLSVYDSTYCDYTLKYIDVQGFMVKGLADNCKVPIGSSLCELLTDNCTLLEVNKGAFPAIISITQFGDNYIIFQHSLVTGPNNDIWYFFERNINLKAQESLPETK